MVKNKRALITAVFLIVVAAIVWYRAGDPAASSDADPAAPVRSAAGGGSPWIHLDRLKNTNPTVALGRRNLFAYAPTQPPVTPPPPAPPMDTPSLEDLTPTPVFTPPPPPITLKFMGVVQPDGGKKIALILTAQKEILHGREGDVLAGRYRIAKIGIESLEVEEVTTGQRQTIRIGGR